jgi:hypothetical protein
MENVQNCDSGADNLTAFYEPIVLDNVESLTSHNLIGPHGLLRG